MTRSVICIESGLTILTRWKSAMVSKLAVQTLPRKSTQSSMCMEFQ